MTLSVRALAWGCVSVAILLGGMYALALVFFTLHAAGGSSGAPGNVQGAALSALVWTVAREAVLPVAALSFVLWLVLARLAPRIDASRWALAASLPACALLAFPIVGLTFEAWKPGGAGDVVATAALLSASVGAALWIARRLVPGLPPGAFGARRR